jgi:hypothetical protein
MRHSPISCERILLGFCSPSPPPFSHLLDPSALEMEPGVEAELGKKARACRAGSMCKRAMHEPMRTFP